MEGKSKDVNQLYKEMEEAVAQKVRETMELADARRQALAQGTITRKEIASYIEDIKKKSPQIGDATKKSIGTLDKNVQLDNNYYTPNTSNDTYVPQKQETLIEDRLKKEEEEIGDVRPNKTKDVQIGFESFETASHPEKTVYEERPGVEMGAATLILAQNATRNHPLQKNVKTDQLESTPSSVEHKIGFQHFEELRINPSQKQSTKEFEENKLELAQGALKLAQNAVRNTEILSWEDTDARGYDKLQEISNLTQNPSRNNNNNPFEMDANEELRRAGENALLLAENAAQAYATNPFQISDDEVEIKLNEHTTPGNQNDPRDKTTNPFHVIEDQPERKRLGEEALSLARSGLNTKNPFESVEDEDQAEIMQLGTNALSIAQTGAIKIEAVNRQLSENSEDIDNAFNSLLDSAELKEPLIQIGFDSIEDEIEETVGQN